MTGSEADSRVSQPSPLNRVCLAISSYRNDSEVLDRLERIKDFLTHFGRVLIVDSLGTGAVPNAIQERGWTNVDYVSFDRNLGSAGNLEARLRLAAEYDVDWVYAVNHDGDANPEAMQRLLGVARAAHGNIGAVYPLRCLPARGNAFDVTGVRRVPFTAVRRREPPPGDTLDVFWSSSNGALYSVTPVRQGLAPWDDLWMGYEDLGYGWLLHRHGYRQILALTVQTTDGYEYRQRASLWITAKPSWYAYYYARNFVTVARRTQQPLTAQAAVLIRVLMEFGVTTVLRNEKRKRLEYTARGLIDGVRGRMGKWRVP
jgi:GT2 family glycosyltransferase